MIFFKVNMQIYFPFSIFPFLAEMSILAKKKLHLKISCIINTCGYPANCCFPFPIWAKCLIWLKKSHLIIHLDPISNMFSAVRKFSLYPPPLTLYPFYICMCVHVFFECLLNLQTVDLKLKSRSNI